VLGCGIINRMRLHWLGIALLAIGAALSLRK
jgi:hypothetical protein